MKSFPNFTDGDCVQTVKEFVDNFQSNGVKHGYLPFNKRDLLTSWGAIDNHVGDDRIWSFACDGGGWKSQLRFGKWENTMCPKSEVK